MDYNNFVTSLSLDDRKRLCKKIDKFIDFLSEISGKSDEELSDELDVIRDMKVLASVASPIGSVHTLDMPKDEIADRKPRINRIKVVFADGFTIYDSKGELSYIGALRHIGFDKVAGCNVKTDGDKLLVSEMPAIRKDVKRYTLVEGFYVYSFKSNHTRIKYLNKICRQLAINIKVYCS